MTTFNTQEALLQIRSDPTQLKELIAEHGPRIVVPQIVGFWIQDHILKEKEQGTMPGPWIDAILEEKTIQRLKAERNWPLMACLLNEAQKMESSPMKKERWVSALGNVETHPDIKSAFDFGLMDAIGKTRAYQENYHVDNGELRLDSPSA